MQYFPAFLKLDETRRVLIVGGGEIARSKIETLLPYARHMHVVSPHIAPALEHAEKKCHSLRT